MIRAAKMAGQGVVIDGCPIGYAKKIVDAHSVPVDHYAIVTELGIDKTHDLEIDDDDVAAVVKDLSSILKENLDVMT